MSSPLIYLTCVVVLGVAAQWVAWRCQLPAILLLLGTGFALGRWIAPQDVLEPTVVSAAVSMSVAVILFEGGLSLRLRDLAATGLVMVRLVTIGCAVTWILATLAGRALIFETWAVATLAGAIFTVTGPTVIRPLLRDIRPKRRVGAVSRWEGIVIDPIGALLALLVFEFIEARGAENAATAIALVFANTIVVAILVGGGAAAAIILLLRRHWLPDYLHAPVLLATVLGAFLFSDVMQHVSGLATVTVMGIVLANQKIVAIEHISKFKESLGILLLGGLFIVLAGRLEPADLAALGWSGLLFVAIMILLVRPISILCATAGSALDRNERLFLGWLAPRGVVAAAVSGVFALQLQASVVGADADRLVPTAFLLIVVTVLVYGLTAKPLAQRLGVADPNPQGLLILGADPLGRAIGKAVADEGISVLLVDSRREEIAAARMEGLRTQHGNILSEKLQEDLNLTGLGRLLALTPYDEANTLAAIAFTEAFERANVFQLPSPKAQTRQTGQGGENRPAGRRLFSPEATYEELARRLAAGAVIKKTLLTPEFDYQAFRRHYGGRTTLLFVRGKNGSLTVAGIDDPPSPAPGQKIISLIEAGAIPGPTPSEEGRPVLAGETATGGMSSP